MLLTPEETLDLAGRLVTFANEPSSAAAIHRLFGSSRDFPLRGRAAEYEAIRAEVRHILLRSPEDRRDGVQEFLASRTGRRAMVPWTRLQGHLRLTDNGQLVMLAPRFTTVADVIGVTLAELESRDAPGVILKCAGERCDRFFVRERSRGRPQQFCSKRCKQASYR
jgi:hypothetical protein